MCLCVRSISRKSIINRNTTRLPMISILNPVPTLFSESQQKLPGSIFPAIAKTRNPPAEWNIQEDDLATFSCKDSIKDFSGINDSLSPILGEDFHFRKYENNAVYFILFFFFF